MAKSLIVFRAYALLFCLRLLCLALEGPWSIGTTWATSSPLFFTWIGLENASLTLYRRLISTWFSVLTEICWLGALSIESLWFQFQALDPSISWNTVCWRGTQAKIDCKEGNSAGNQLIKHAHQMLGIPAVCRQLLHQKKTSSHYTQCPMSHSSKPPHDPHRQLFHPPVWCLHFGSSLIEEKSSFVLFWINVSSECA